jgi:hypothetical protein
MAKVQDKLKDCIENRSLKSLDRIANLLHTSNEEEMDTTANEGAVVAVDALETIKDLKGMNAIPVKKSRKARKHLLQRQAKALASPKEDKPKPRPKHFVQF